MSQKNTSVRSAQGDIEDINPNTKRYTKLPEPTEIDMKSIEGKTVEKEEIEQ